MTNSCQPRRTCGEHFFDGPDFSFASGDNARLAGFTPAGVLCGTFGSSVKGTQTLPSRPSQQ